MNPIKKAAYRYISHKHPRPDDAWPRRIPTHDINAPVPPGQNRSDSAGAGRHRQGGPRHITGGEPINP